ncbi:MAG: hypothetical protein R3304_01650 [Longimicrobiales bacterium]|nr:hypothetical protein [Longimicrobiales bacterium]
MSGEPASRHEFWIVDTVGEATAVLVLADEEGAPVVSDVALQLLGDRAEVGAVLRVPLGQVGEPVWERAERVDPVSPPGPRTGPSDPG